MIDFAALRQRKACEQAKQGRFADAVGAFNEGEPAGGQGGGDILKDGSFIVG